MNNLAKVITHERTPFIYIRKSGTYLGNVTSLDTPFLLGDITQIYTATLILQLHEEGDLSLEDPVTQYFQHNALPFNDQVTLGHLLSHRAGLIDQDQKAKEIKIYSEQNHTFTLEELIKDYTFYDPTAIGEVHFSDTGYYILGRIIEQVTRTSFEEYLYEQIIGRLDLKNTCIYLYDLECKPVPGYVDLEELGLGEGHRLLENHQALMSSTFSAGYIASSAHDLQTFMKHVINGTFFDFTIMEEFFAREGEWSDDEKSVRGRSGYGLIDFGKKRYGNIGATLESSTQVIIEKDTGEVYLYFFGEPGLLR